MDYGLLLGGKGLYIERNRRILLRMYWGLVTKAGWQSEKKLSLHNWSFEQQVWGHQQDKWQCIGREHHHVGMSWSKLDQVEQQGSIGSWHVLGRGSRGRDGRGGGLVTEVRASLLCMNGRRC